MRMIRSAIILWAASAAWLSAQEQISADAFLERVNGRTATFTNVGNGELVGIEQFLSPERSVWARADGSCAFGTIYTKQEEEVCFVYDDDPVGVSHCWVPFANDKEIFVVSTNSGGIQEVTEINDEPVDCKAPPTS